jgi:hypothetical protein
MLRPCGGSGDGLLRPCVGSGDGFLRPRGLSERDNTIFRFRFYFFMCGAFLYVRYSFLLISNKFCDLSLLLWVRVQCGKKNVPVLHCAPSLSHKAELWALEAHVHKTTYGPLIDTAL